MGNVNCSGASLGKNKEDKRGKKSSKAADNSKGFKTLHVNIEHPSKSFEGDDLKSSSFTVPVPFGIAKNSRCNVKVMNLESPVGGETEHAYEGEDEHDESMSMRRENSDSDFQAQPGYTKEDNSQQKDGYESFDINVNDQHEIKTKKDADEVIDRHRIISGHISDPGVGRAKFCASPKLKRSCSDLTRREMVRVADQLPLSKSQSFEEIQKLTKRLNGEILPENSESPLSVRTRCSADKVILKKHSSSQILPSRSQKIWWKLFLWSHRNLHSLGFAKAQPKPVLNQQGGYSSDTLEARKSMESSKSKSPRSFTEESPKTGDSINDNHSWDGFQGISSFWPQNQWVAFPAESSTFSRVDQWVKELPLEPLPEKNDDSEDGIPFPPSPDSGIPPARSSAHLSLQSNLNIPEEIVHANSVIQSLNSSSTVAHIAGTGLKVIPFISRFFSLRSVNFSGNFIVHITPGSLPKALHVLNLSRNKINTIEGLRDLTRLRVLDLSYNRISRIGQGLSNCSLIKELYLAGNKISEVEGLHRLLKLTILDLSFNKITTTKALGQLVANYNSLLALNLLGNPIQSNISEDQLRKTACSLLPKLAFLNKQPINPQKAREVRSEAIVRAAMGDSIRSSRRKAMKRVSQGGSSSSSVHNSRVHVTQKSRHRSKSRTHHHSSLKKSSLPASSSH